MVRGSSDPRVEPHGRLNSVSAGFTVMVRFERTLSPNTPVSDSLDHDAFRAFRSIVRSILAPWVFSAFGIEPEKDDRDASSVAVPADRRNTPFRTRYPCLSEQPVVERG